MSIGFSGARLTAVGVTKWRFAPLLGTAAAALGLVTLGGAAYAAPPPAGTIIGNQAIATFNDGTTTRSVSSNLVQTEINQIYGVDIEADQTKDVSLGGLVVFPHTVTNTGNGTDVFNLTPLAAAVGDFDTISVYADANCDGVADSATLISETPALGPDEKFCVVVEADVSTTPAAGSATSFTLTAQSQGSSGTTDVNTDTLTVTTGPVLDVTKSVMFAPATGDTDSSGTFTPGDILTVRLTYSNSQADTNATAFIEDDLAMTLASPAGAVPDFTVVPGSFVWSDGFALDEATDGFDEATNAPDSYVAADITTPDATNASGESIDVYLNNSVVEIGVDINSGAQTREGYVEFQIEIGTTAAGTPVNVATINAVPSNEVPIPIASQDVIAVVLNDVNSGSAAYVDRSTSDLPDAGGSWTAGSTTSSTDDDATVGNDIITEVGPVAEGAVVPFEVILTNHSNTEQRFNLSASTVNPTLTVGAVSFPPETTFSFYTAGGSPLLDVDADGVPDILVGANTAVAVQVRADLPLGYTSTAPTSGTVRATASADPTVFNRTAITINEVAAARVDLENAGNLADEVIGDPSADLDDGGAPWTELTVNPGETAAFPLVVENESLAADSFNLSFSDTDFSAGTLPAGWTVVFRDSGGSLVVNTGVIAAGSFENFTAEVTPPAGETPGPTDIYFRATSATNGTVSDTKLDRVIVAAVADLALSPDREGQVAPGGALVLSHTLENLGNTTVTEGEISFTDSFGAPLAGTLYLDDGDGVFELNGEDIVIDNIDDIGGGIASGDAVTIFNRVQASAAAVAGQSDSATITVSGSLNGGLLSDAELDNNAVTDLVTIVSGDLDVVKTQALDTGCDGADTVFGTAQISADPGDCIVYQVTATNTGTVNATSVQIIDTTPAFTTQEGTASATGGTTPAITMEPGTDAAGDIVSDHDTLWPGAVATLTFTVQIDE